MSSQLRNEYTPDRVSPPGGTLQDILDSVGMTQSQLAERLGRSRKTVNQIIKGKAPLTAETALQLERVLGVPAAFWSNRERHFREHLAKLEEEARLQLHPAWVARFPVKVMAARGWVRESSGEVGQLRELLNFFGVASPQQWRDIWLGPHVAFRTSPAFEASPEAVAAWLRKGELEAQNAQCAPFDVQGFRAVLSQVRTLTTGVPSSALQEAARICGLVGVAVVVVEELPKTHVCGATRWLSPSRALIQLSFRYRTDDHLWFTFFHEAAHVLKGGKKDIFVDDDQTRGPVPEMAEEERLADRFAEDQLIPPAPYRRFVARAAPYFRKEAIRAFAEDVGVGPGVVVGRLQHDGHLAYSQRNDLKQRVELS